MRSIIFILLLPIFLIAQKTIDVTGRASLNTIYFDYNEKSEIKPDSVDSKSYSKTNLIPGFQQLLNLAIFARTRNLDISLLSDVRNNKWDELDAADHKSIDRISLSIRYASHEFVAGDFFESGSEFFMQSREIRGGKLSLKFNDLWNPRSYLTFRTVGGISQKSFRQGERLPSIYKQYETSGQYRRNMIAASAGLGETGLFRTAFHYLYARDDVNSISKSLNDPLANQNIGGDAALFLWDNRIQLFGEGFFSTKDTINYKSAADHSYKGGLDFRYEQFKLIAFYQRLGSDYFTAGSPFLLNDRKGFRVQSAYSFPEVIYLGAEYEQYSNNLADKSTAPVTDTRITEFSATTVFKNLPEITVRFGLRDDLSNSVFSGEELDQETKTDKISMKYEARISYNINQNRFSLSTIYLDLNDGSKIVGGDPLGTEQIISSFNFYTRPARSFFISGGAVYSRLLLTNGKDIRNIFLYQSNRWDIVAQKLFFESNINFSSNESQNGGNDDLLNGYEQFNGQLSLEYFFNSNVSLKLIGGSNLRSMNYSTNVARQLLENPSEDIDPTFFNGNESYNALIYGAEINWIF